MGNRFDKEYGENKCLWGKNPSKNAKETTKYKNAGKILDLGCGEGRDSIFFAKNGFEVTSIDISEKAIEKLEKRALENNLDIKTEIEDIKNYKIKEEYDVINALNVFHFLKPNDALKIINEIKEKTSPKGINSITIFNELNPDKNFPYLMKKNELKRIYKDWKILKYEEIETQYEKHGKRGKWHKHNLSRIIAMKPNLS